MRATLISTSGSALRMRRGPSRGPDTDRYDLVITVDGLGAQKSATLLPLFVERLGPVMSPELAA
jgi:hypothetical protein